MDKRGNEQNLWQHNQDRFTAEQRREWASKAGKASAAARRKLKSQREILRQILSLKCDDDEARSALRALGLDETFANAANLAVLRRAVRGDVDALRYVRDTIGEKPADTMTLGLLDKPVKSLELSGLSDAELEALADRTEDEGPEPKALPEVPIEG